LDIAYPCRACRSGWDRVSGRRLPTRHGIKVSDQIGVKAGLASLTGRRRLGELPTVAEYRAGSGILSSCLMEVTPSRHNTQFVARLRADHSSWQLTGYSSRDSWRCCSPIEHIRRQPHPRSPHRGRSYCRAWLFLLPREYLPNAIIFSNDSYCSGSLANSSAFFKREKVDATAQIKITMLKVRLTLGD